MQKSIWETRAPIVDLARAAAYKIHKCIASSVARSLTNLNHLIVGRTRRRLFVQKALFYEEKNSKGIICRIINYLYYVSSLRT